MTRFWELIFVSLLVVWSGALFGGGLFAIAHSFRTEPGVILGALALIALVVGGSVIAIGSALARRRGV